LYYTDDRRKDEYKDAIEINCGSWKDSGGGYCISNGTTTNYTFSYALNYLHNLVNVKIYVLPGIAYGPEDYAKSKLSPAELDLGPNVAFSRYPGFHFGTGSGQGRAVVPIGFRYLDVANFNPDVIHTQTFFGLGLEALMASDVLGGPDDDNDDAVEAPTDDL